MTLFTTYLSKVQSVRHKALPIFVMRNRGNGAVEPPEMVLRLFLEGAISWEAYRDAYLDSLKDDRAIEWMKQMAEKSKKSDIVLVCLEKDPQHCHRVLLAQQMEHYGADYKGEIT